MLCPRKLSLSEAEAFISALQLPLEPGIVGSHRVGSDSSLLPRQCILPKDLLVVELVQVGTLKEARAPQGS